MSLQSLTNMNIKCIDKNDKHYRINLTKEGIELLNKEVQQILYYKDRCRTKTSRGFELVHGAKQYKTIHSQKLKI